MDDQPASPDISGAAHVPVCSFASSMRADPAHWPNSVHAWLESKAIYPQIAQVLGMQVASTALDQEWLVLYPRHLLAGGVGYKVRSIDTGRTWNDPNGIDHRQTIPWMCNAGADNLIIVEGETDFLALASSTTMQHFDAAIMCVPGANAFPQEWVQYIPNGDVYVVPDGDKAGEQMMARISSLWPRARWARMPDGNDISDLLMHDTGEWFLRNLIDEARYYERKVPIRRQSWTMNQGAANQNRHKLIDFASKDTHLRRRGHHELVGLCPFHDEKTPSFFINTEKYVFHCQGCGKSGDVINYLVEKGLSYREAFRMVEQ